MTNIAYEPGPNDVAVTGLALHVPGADSVFRFWRNLRDGVESVRRFTDEELKAAGVSTELLANPNYVKAGTVLENLAMFDAEFFGLSPKEAAVMDPQHRHFLECAWEALESAGHPPAKFDGRIGVFAGCGMGSYFLFNVLTNPELVQSTGLFMLRHTGNDKDFLTTRVSYSFNLTGPSVSIQTACSTSLVAVHTACQSLLAGECDMALAGGVTIELPPGHGYLYKKNDILSPEGRCRAFDHRSQGTIFGSGAGVAALRRAEDALRDGDHIFAIIKGSAVNNDGSSKVGYFAPSVAGQAAAAAEALAVAGISADAIGYMECHGTGTPIGDPIEIAAMTEAHRQTTDRKGYCAIGSVKTNIGHLDTAAGVVGMAKAALALEHRQIPPSLNYEAPNPSIDFANSPFFVNAKLTEWRDGETPRRATVNSLGVGGTNAHAVLEEPPTRVATSPPQRSQQLLVLSARNRGALDDASQRLAEHLREHPEQPLADVAFTLLNGRHEFDVRRVVAARDHAEAAALLSANDAERVFTHKAETTAPSVVFLLPGGGAQYPRMGRELYESEPVFREWIDRGLSCLAGKLDVDLRKLWFADSDRDAENAAAWQRPSIQLPAIYLCEYALAQLWMSWGVRPAALVGHSMGENTAAALSGVLSFEDGLDLVTMRGRLFERVPRGGMLSVPLSAEAVTELLGDRLDLATVNAPEMCAVSGPVDALDELAAKLTARGVEAKRIPIDIAAHSRMLEPILADFERFLRTLTYRKPTIPFTSNLTGAWITEAQATDPRYWVDHLRSTVRFADCLGTVMQQPGRVLLEVGPGKTLASLARQHAAVTPSHTVVSSLRHPKETISDVTYFLTVFGRLWAAGVAVDTDRLWAGESRRRVQLPTYAFQRRRYWIEPGRPTTEPTSNAVARIADPRDWYYRAAWKRRELEATVIANSTVAANGAAARSTWLVFVDEAGVGERLVAKLRAAGDDVVTVRAGDAYHRTSATEYLLSPEHGDDGYRALVRDLAASGKLPNRVVHLWLATADESFRPGSSFFHRNLEQGFFSLLFLAQAMGGESLPGSMHWSVVSTGMQQVGDERPAYPEKATVLGPCGVVPRELPETTCSSIDMVLPTTSGGLFGKRRRYAERLNQLVDRLYDEVRSTPRNDAVALRDDGRYVEEFERTAAPATSTVVEGSSPRLRMRGSYLITGGLGGIGLTIAEHLARTVKARLVLVGRSAFPPSAEWDGWLRSHAPENGVSATIRRLREIESLGGEVLTIEADVTDVEAMRDVVDAATRRFGAIHGVVHAAGLLRDNLIAAKTQGEIEDVFAPKLHGTMVLDELFADVPLDFFLLCSSTSTILAAAGQVDYVAANAFLNAYAASRHRPQRPVIALNWGVWNEVGMAARALGNVATPAIVEEPVVHPLFDYRLGGVHDKTITLVGRHSTLAHWVYDEHRTAVGQAVLPGTGYLELARAALAELGRSEPFELCDVFFLRPLTIEERTACDVVVQLTRADTGYDFVVQSKHPTDDGRVGLRTHAQGRIVLGRTEPPQVCDFRAIRNRCSEQRQHSSSGALRTKQEDHVRFGRRWRVLHEIAYGAGEATAELELHADFRNDLEQYALHPALLDMATGFAMSLIRGYETCDDLWVPVSYRRLNYYGPLTSRLVSWVKSRGDNHAGGEFAQFDIVIGDSSGRVLVEIEGFSIKRLTKSEAFGDERTATTDDLRIDDVATNRPGAGGDDGEVLSAAEAAIRANLRNGIRPAEGAAAFEAIVRGATANRVIVSSLDLAGLIAQADAQRPQAKPVGDLKFERPKSEAEFIEPRDNVERSLATMFEDLLGVEGVGATDSFFDLGGHSLIAVRLFAQIKKTYACDFAMSVLFGAPTVEALGNLIKAEIGSDAEEQMGSAAGDGDAVESGKPARKQRFLHLVPMHEGPGGAKRPLFIVSGMFGNILNLRHLAHLIGDDRPCYGLQARGLYGEDEPHATLEETAADYLRELRSVQPHGPYLLSGFSGGGLTAYEMAVQLRREGEEVAFLGLLDTPLVRSEQLTKLDKLKMHLQRLQREKHRYFWNFISGRLAWEWKQLKRRFFASDAPPPPASFHSEAIGKAFLAACDVYQTPRYDDKIVLFRPKLKPIHVFGPDRMINVDRRFIYPDNGWSRYVPEVQVHEVPGDHDSMVLEPNVRTLGAKVRKAILAAEAAYDARRRREEEVGRPENARSATAFEEAAS